MATSGMHGALGLVLAAVAVLGGARITFASDAARPNIIVIYTDDQGYGDASCLNPEAKFQTPNIDRLAREGVSFTNAHSAAAVCSPSRYGLLTGRYCWRTRLKRGVLRAEAPGLIADDRMTLASLLRDNGYHTAMVGKWHLGMDFPGTPGDRDWSQPVTDMPLDKGFDHFFGIPASLNYGVLAWFEGRHAAVPPTLFTNKKPNDRHVDYRIMPPYQASPGETKELLGAPGMEVAPDFIDNQCLTRFTDKAIEWMTGQAESAKAGKPFFLYLPYTSPHYPVCPLPEFHGQGQCGAYGEFVIETDHHVGRILRFLEESGLDHDTMIVFTSDNGPAESWQERIEDFGHRSSHVYRGGKREIYEGGHRVPFFVRWPAGIRKPGRNWTKPIGQVDLLATIAELIRVSLPADAGEDSQSFLCVLEDPKANYERVPLINHSVDGRFAVTEGDWKLVLPDTQSGMELYDLARDPSETKNLADQHPERVEALEQKATDAVLDGRTTPGPRQSNDTPHWDHLTWISEQEYASRQPTRRDQPARPNIIVIISDDCGYNDFSMQGSKLSTPRIDSIAASGVRFTNGYVSGSVCSPTRAGLLTGRYQQKFGHEFNIRPIYSDDNGLPLTETLLPAVLGKAGYESMAFGKWHLGYAPKFHPMERGFTHYYGFLQGSRSYFPLAKPTRLNQLLRDREPVRPEPPTYMTDQLAEEAADYISLHHTKPFFIYLAFNATHGPNQATEQDLKAAEGKTIPAMTIALDRAVGKVLDALEEHELTDQTLVVFLNDNGGTTAHDNTPLRGFKGSTWEGGMRVPFVMQWPAVIPKGLVYDKPVISLDIFPTALAAAGVAATPAMQLDGVNLLPYLTGDNTERPHSELYWKSGKNWAIRSDDLKLVQQQEDTQARLYDLGADVGETTDIAASRPDDVARMTALYEAWKATHRATPWEKKERK